VNNVIFLKSCVTNQKQKIHNLALSKMSIDMKKQKVDKIAVSSAKTAKDITRNTIDLSELFLKSNESKWDLSFEELLAEEEENTYYSFG
jgi:hypothetical protein